MVTFLETQDAAVRLKGLKVIKSTQSAKQKIDIYVHPVLGKCLVLNGELHHVEAWQSLYHEPLVHLPTSFIPEIKTALVLGGGCLFAAHEILKYRGVKRIDLIEYDNAVIDTMHEHYSHANSILNDKRFNLIIADARCVFHDWDEQYDLIINDCFDLSRENIDKKLTAYEALENLLSREGLCGDVVYRHIFEKRTVQESLRALAQRRRTAFSLIAIPEYPGILHLLTVWGRNRYLKQESKIIRNKIQRRYMLSGKGIEFDFYDPRHRSFYLFIPPYLKRSLSQAAI